VDNRTPNDVQYGANVARPAFVARIDADGTRERGVFAEPTGRFAARAASSAATATFALTCDPFGGLAEHQPIDDRCGPDGLGSAASVAQNHAKNNLCAPVPATRVDFTVLRTLQADVPALGIPFGTPQTIPSPADRPKLQHPDTTHGISVGEGSLVQFVGFLIEAHYSDTSSGESVNCNIPGNPTNDIHIAIGPALGAPECESVTAEIIPHFRPHAWTALATWNGPNAASRIQSARLARPLRFTGHLMFEASHAPCVNGTPAKDAPSRSSSWEVHPVYHIDVCKSAALVDCSATDEAAWTPLDQFLSRPTT
jgi:hypothetical protein